MKTAASQHLLPNDGQGSEARKEEFLTPDHLGVPALLRKIEASVRWRSWMLLFLLVTAATRLGTMPSSAVESSSLEYKVKAAFLYNFAKFVEWPPEKFLQPDSPIIIGVVGEDPFGNTLDETVKGKTINGRKIVIQRFAPEEDLKHCHLLFISRSLRDSLDPMLAGLSSEKVLTVSETDKFAQRGGIINFTIVNESVKFEINLATAEQAGLRISSKLSSVARVIRSEPPNVN